MGGHQSHDMQKDEWLTPPAILEALGPFDLDPCAPINRPWPMAAQHYTVSDNGLALPWSGMVWCNPPYGAHTEAWLEKLAQHGTGIALIFARTETAAFFSTAWGKATAMLFLEGRLFFHHVTGDRAAHNGGAPSVLLAYGDVAASRLEQCSLRGAFVRPGGWIVKKAA